MPKRHVLVFFVFIVASFILMTFQSKRGHVFHDNIFYLLLNFSNDVIQSTAETIKKPFRTMALREEENQRLQGMIKNLLLENKQHEEILLENRRLKEILRLRDSANSYVASGEIISRGLQSRKDTVIINKGADDGIKKNMAVITPRGLAGKIVAVTDSYSDVLLMTNINFSAAVRLQASRTEGIVSGTGTGKCVLKYLPYGENLNTGDIVVTSGLDALFPTGIPVGYVSRIDRQEKRGHFQYIEIVPFQDDKKLEEVIIIQ
jgi:rod shape-determining protein MreC